MKQTVEEIIVNAYMQDNQLLATVATALQNTLEQLDELQKQVEYISKYCFDADAKEELKALTDSIEVEYVIEY